MPHSANVYIQEENEFEKIVEKFKRYYYLFIIGVVVALSIAYLVNRYSKPAYKISSSIQIKKPKQQNVDDYINSSLFGTNQNLQDELLILKSTPIISQTIENLNLSISYYKRIDFQYRDAYRNVPFSVLYMNNHIQPLHIYFEILFFNNSLFEINATGKDVVFYNFEKRKEAYRKSKWSFKQKGKIGQLIETPEISLLVDIDSTKSFLLESEKSYYFKLCDIPTLTQELKSRLDFKIVDVNANAIEINLKSESMLKGIDILNGITNVYSKQNLEKKNHLADITIDYIDKQIGEISDSLNRTESILQNFRSSNRLLNVSEQSAGISAQYRDLENQRADIVTKKKYYEYVLDYLSNNEDFTNIIVPSSLGIQDQLLNALMADLINAQSQKGNLVDNKQDKNPAVKRLTARIENLKKTIIENISYVLKTTEISLDELNKRISKVQAEISRIPNTERQLTGIERKFRLNDAIYSYLMEKRAEANITRASNLPDNEILEPASGLGPISPNKKMNYIVAFILGIIVPYGYLNIKSALNSKIVSQDQIEQITDAPVLGKILHNTRKTNNVVFEIPESNIAESYRSLRTNLEFYVRGGSKVIMITSSVEGEGKSFNALNIAMSYAQLDRKTILLNFDFRKPTFYFNGKTDNDLGLTSYLINKATLDDIIINSACDKLHYISSGPVPPNPVELIAMEKTRRLLNQLKEKYDYIIIDTPPLAQVADAYLLLDYADVKVIISRISYTPKRVLSLIMKDLSSKSINNTCIVLNDNRNFRDQYGYGYGYQKKKIINRLT